MTWPFTDFFQAHFRLFLTLHLLGVVLGMGGATIADLLFFNFLKDFDISKKEAHVLHLLSNLIMAALGILLISGIALFLSDPVTFGASAAFRSKMVIVSVIAINGILMHKFIAPHMVKISFLRTKKNEHPSLMRLRKTAFFMGAISFTSWYTAFFIAMLKSYIPASASMAHILGAYVCILIIAIFSGQMIHAMLHVRGRAT